MSSGRLALRMRVVSLDRFGGPEVLELAQAPRPVPGEGEVLVRVRAAGINPVDYKQRAGRGHLTSLPMILGWDVAGVIADIGSGVTIFSPGDEVYGMPRFPGQAGAYADFLSAPARQLVAKPAALSFDEAGALPLAGLTAWQLLVDTAHVRAGQRVLIHAAAGGVGMLAVQIAKAHGAYVIGTAKATNHETLRALGVDEVVDYTAVRFEDAVDKVDVVLDLVGGDYPERSLAVVSPGGTVLSIPGDLDPKLVTRAATAGVRLTHLLVEPDRMGMLGLSNLVEQGRLTVRVGAVLPLEEARAAHRIAETHAVDGKVVLSTEAG